jgi:nicotinamide mononucleotide (NMN) deamidase PncC
LRSPMPIAHAPTPIAGSSDVADRRFVNYASAAKSEMLEIPLT